MTTKVLGKNTTQSSLKGIKILDNIERNQTGIKYGLDIWNVYDFLFRDKNNLPKLKVLEISIPSTSKYIVESKSMKLYLNEFYNISFKRDSLLIAKIKTDLEKIIHSDVHVRFVNKFDQEPSYLNINDTSLVKSKSNSLLKFNGFRSICPVTSQPDFANVYIYSDKQMSIKWVREYLMSYQDQGDFHEQCIEAIFNDVNDEYNCEHLEVCGRFQRRGGIDINPIRGNKKNILFKNFREFNQ